MYYYVVEEYRVANELLTEDIYVRFPSGLVRLHRDAVRCACLLAVSKSDCADVLSTLQALQAAVQRIEAYVRELEAKVDTATRKK